MKKHALILSVLWALMVDTTIAQLANSYPADIGIEKDPNVLFAEKFDDGMANILSRYTDVVNKDGMSLDSDVPPGSKEPYSIRMTSKQGINEGGHLFKHFTHGFDSTVYVRYYVKYPAISKGYFHHEGVWFGGYNPATNWPNPRAGTGEMGNSRLSIAYENIWPGDYPGMDTYLYWGDMKGGAQGLYYGNSMITEGRITCAGPPTSIPPIDTLDQWMCVEITIFWKCCR